MNILPLVKTITELAVSAGTGAVVNNLVQATTPANLSRFKKILVGVGTFAISSWVAEASARTINGQIEDVVNGFKKGHALAQEESE